MICAEPKNIQGYVEQEHKVNSREVTGIPTKGSKKLPKNV